VGSQERQDRARPDEDRYLVWRRWDPSRAPAGENFRLSDLERAVAGDEADRAPEVDPFARRQGGIAFHGAGRQDGCYEQVRSEQELVIAGDGERVGGIGEDEVTHDRKAGLLVLRLGGDEIRKELRAELRPASPVSDLIVVVDLGPIDRRNRDSV